MTVKDRTRILLENAARCFEELRSPFDASELEKMDVTLDECGDLSQHIGTIIRAYLASQKTFDMAMVRGAVEPALLKLGLTKQQVDLIFMEVEANRRFRDGMKEFDAAIQRIKARAPGIDAAHRRRR